MRKMFGKEKHRDPITPKMPQNPYYESLSARFGILQVILYLSLFAFVVISLIGNTQLITYRNFYYFFRDLNTSFESVDSFAADSVSYPTAEEQSFVLYRNGLAVAGNTSVTVFTETGRQTVSQALSYKKPIAKGTGKYLLVYELGGTQYSLYNSYTQIHSASTQYPIRGAAVSDSGMYAIVTDSEEYTSVVSLYSSNFSLINRYNKNDYVMDLDINEDGSELAILTTAARDGLFHTELILHVPRSSEQGTTVAIGNSLALRCAYTSSGGVGVLCSNGYSYADRAHSVSFFDFDGRSIVSADLSTDGLAIALKDLATSSQQTLLVFDRDGNLTYNETAPVSVRQLVRYGNSVFLTDAHGITRVNVNTGKSVSIACETERHQLLAQNETDVVLCSAQKAEFLRLK